MLAVTIFNKRQHLQRFFAGESLCAGTECPSSGDSKADFLTIDDPLVSSSQFSLQWKSDGTNDVVELTNHGRSLALDSGPRIHRGRTTTLPLPLSFGVGDTQVQIFDTEAEHPLDFALTTLQQCQFGSESDDSESATRVSPGPDTLAAWLESLSDLQRSAAGSKELFKVAARAIFNPGGLDGGIVLIRSGSGWEVAASYIPHAVNGVGFREDLIEMAVESRETLFHDAKLVDADPTIQDFHTAIICPVLGSGDDVVGVVYGFRSLHGRNNRRGIRILEAQFAQVVADSLSAGMIRLESEAEATRSKVLLEQVFSPKIAQRLQTCSEVLESKECEVSVLFADLRRFSTISEKIGNRDTYELLADVMDSFSKIIRDLDGVIIDFYGDGVSAFWNAPIEQPEHATFACMAGLEMLERLVDLNKIWAQRLGEELRVGIGVHTGLARVGNSGSRTRIKYGPRGNTVNLASRLETVTKQIGVPMLISGETAKRVEGTFSLRKVIRKPLKGIKTPTNIFELRPLDNPVPSNNAQHYSRALNLVESGQFSEAVVELNSLLSQYPNDSVVEFLLGEVQRFKGSDQKTDLDRTQVSENREVNDDDSDLQKSRDEENASEDTPDRHMLFGKK